MPGNDQTDDRPPRFRRIACLIVVAAFITAANDDPRARGADADPVPAASIKLSASKVRYWDDAAESVRYVILEDKAAAIQDGDGLRANAMVARIRPVRVNGMVAYVVDVYAEGKARTTHPDSPSVATRRVTLKTTGEVPHTAFTTGGLVPLENAPKDAIVRRAFPKSTEPQPKAAPKEATPSVEAPLPSPLPSPTPTPSLSPAIRPTPEAGPVATLGAPVGTDPAAILEDPPVGQAPPRKDPQPTTMMKTDPEVIQAQGPGEPIIGGPPIIEDPDLMEQDPRPPVPPPDGRDRDVPAVGDDPLPGALPAQPEEGLGPAIASPLRSDSRRTFSVSGGPNFDQKSFENKETGEITMVLRGGINVVANLPRKVPDPKPGQAPMLPYTSVDLTADNMVIFTRRNKNDKEQDAKGGVSTDPKEPLQIYLEGHVRIRKDDRKTAGKADETVFEAESAFYDLRTKRMVALNGRIFTSTPTLLSPLKTTGRRIDQYYPIEGVDKTGDYLLGPSLIRVDTSSSTGSRFPYPGYRFNSSNIDITDITDQRAAEDDDPALGPNGKPIDPPTIQLFEAYNNLYYVGPVPAFYSPYTSFTSDFDPLLRNIRFGSGSIFGQSLQLDFSAFRLLGIKRPSAIDNWNLDVDYLSYRGPAVGTEIGYSGRDIFNDISDPYHKSKIKSKTNQPYYGYFDAYAIQDKGRDVLGNGPAIVTYGPPGAGKEGFQRISLPTFREDRGRLLFRHMQQLLGEDADPDEDFRIQVEAAYISDRYFQEQYYNYQYQAGLDQENLIFGIKQRENRSLTVQGELNDMNWNTETQWLPKVEYTRIGDGWLDNRINTSYRSGIDFANTHTAVEVNNPNIFAYMPYDPVSNTSGPISMGRAYQAGQVDIPLDFTFFKLVPYAQGQVVSWENQIGAQQVNRVWGAVGMRANIFAWRTFTGPQFESELLNVHGLAHKINLTIDGRDAQSNVNLNRLAIQDDLDDNAYEYTRRYFALTNYVGGLLPQQYDPRLLTLRRMVSPITGTTDVQGSMETVQFSLKQRLQTKRGVEGRRRIVDYMTLDLNSTYFPNARRDNFGKPFGQNMYNYEWFIGDRTSIVSYGWFEFWNVNGTPIVGANPVRANDPFGLDVITAGINIQRPPRGSVYIGYSIVNTGPIATSALTMSTTYWLSPKWYAYAAISYDFGNQRNLGNTFSVTKITKDYLISAGLTVQPLLNNNYQFAFELSPRFSPQMRFGSTVGQRFDSRFAPNE